MQELTAVAMLVVVVGGGRGLRKICNLCGRVCNAGYITTVGAPRLGAFDVESVLRTYVMCVCICTYVER